MGADVGELDLPETDTASIEDSIGRLEKRRERIELGYEGGIYLLKQDCLKNGNLKMWMKSSLQLKH